MADIELVELQPQPTPALSISKGWSIDLFRVLRLSDPARVAVEVATIGKVS